MTVNLSSPDLAKQWCKQARAKGLTIGFVPTMGALHPGHVSLIEYAKSNFDVCCVSIFVNPLQFNNPEDLEKYPTNLQEDHLLLSELQCDMTFTGELAQFFPEIKDIASIPLLDPGPAAKGLEGDYRPGHLEGVVSIVNRLFQSVGDCCAVFGEKDFQQTLVVKDLATTLKKQNLNIKIAVRPTIRESSGLAMSSRNRRLTQDQCSLAEKIFKALNAAKKLWGEGQRDPLNIEQCMYDNLNHRDISIEYATIRDESNWTENTPTKEILSPRGLIAVNLDKIRLIDNMQLNSIS